MAILPDDEYQKSQGQPDQAPSQVGGTLPPLTGSGASFGASGGQSSSTAAPGSQPGTGGSNNWTNIQSYLTANQGNNGTADALNKQVEGAFDSERSNFDQQAGQAKSAGQAEVDRSGNTDYASQLLGQAGQDWNGGASYTLNGVPANQGGQPTTGAFGAGATLWQGGPAVSGTPYASDVSNIQSQLSPYSGPSSFSYSGMNGTAQQYGSDLGSDAGFNGLMQNVYNTAAGGQLSGGGLALQQQLDAQNPQIKTVRDALTGKYNDLGNHETQGTTDANSALQQDKTQVAQNIQNTLQPYYQNTADNIQRQISRAPNQQALSAMVPLQGQWNAIQQALQAGGTLRVPDFREGVTQQPAPAAPQAPTNTPPAFSNTPAGSQGGTLFTGGPGQLRPAEVTNHAVVAPDLTPPKQQAPAKGLFPVNTPSDLSTYEMLGIPVNYTGPITPGVGPRHSVTGAGVVKR